VLSAEEPPQSLDVLGQLSGRTDPCRASPHSSPRGLRWG